MNQEVLNIFGNQAPIPTFEKIKISIASPERILSWSFGEIKKPGNDQLPHVQARA